MKSTHATPTTPRPAPAAAHATNGQGRAAQPANPGPLCPTDTFVHRHIGPDDADVAEMLRLLGYASLDEFADAVVPARIRLNRPLDLGPPRGEHELLKELAGLAQQNTVNRSYIGMGYSGTITPPVILRNILENPGWYTQYTPYQAEISQGRLEALLNFQTMVADLTALPLAGASLLDEATAAAEAMAMCASIAGGTPGQRGAFFVSRHCHPQTIGVVQTRAESMGLEVMVGDHRSLRLAPGAFFGVLLQYPDTEGRVEDLHDFCRAARAAGATVVVAADLLALTLLTPPGEFGADIAVGTTQRFGVPMGFGGPHAGYIATRTEHARRMPGRIIGVSRDAHGHTAYRMAIQTREQHIKRERATSNICTAQALLAIIAGMYAVYHGPEGLRAIARRVHALARTLAHGLRAAGHEVLEAAYFDTVRVRPGGSATDARRRLEAGGINPRVFADGTLGFSVDETTTPHDLEDIWAALGGAGAPASLAHAWAQAQAEPDPLAPLARTSEFLSHPVFRMHHSETEMLRYIFRLQGRDLSLAHAMIPLGSCTMKLNATSEMIPVTWPHLAHLHPFAPPEQTRGYQALFRQLEGWLAEITGFAAVSLQPNAGSQGEYAGLLVIRAYHAARGESHRDVCLIPESAHGTNPASAVIAGFRVVVVASDEQGNIDLADLETKARAHARDLAAVMVTYPSTFGVFEEGIVDVCRVVHEHGGQVYMDGANMNAQVGLTSPGFIGADVCHLNLHKTFCVPHGGGGPGMGPIGVAAHLAPFLPSHPVVAPASAGAHAVGPVSAAPYGSASILPISWVYIALMGAAGLKRATQVAMLSANYMAARLEGHYAVLFKGRNGRCAHEFIIDCRPFEKSAGIKADDIAKRLMDYGFHAPTMSFPVPGTLMIEPTESEPKPELDRLCDALIAIREEIRAIERGQLDRQDNPLRNAPHTVAAVSADDWKHTYTRRQAAFPLPWVAEHKFWPAVGRVDNPWGDRNLACVCPPVASYAEPAASGA